mmetsp:Transcript_9996/g.14829  ORF Transcript_9996/g.14829 Transcript_9996/m.14829 type:complete len:328 (+) Transcript_9996:94-1077(+)
MARRYLTVTAVAVTIFLAFQFNLSIPVKDLHLSTNATVPSAALERIKVFYNVYANPDDDVAILRAKYYVNEQMAELLPKHQVFIRSIGKQFEVEGATQIQHDEKGNEVGTLKLLWDHCRETDNPNEKVVYLHNKGSFHPSKTNDLMRKWLTRAALSEECSNMPFSCSVCSWRFSPLPHPHNGGNMWAARCNYIRKLIDPAMFQTSMAQLYHGGNDPWIGTGRFAAEHWVHSHPTIQACDVSTSDYIWAYRDIPELHDDFKLEAAPRYRLREKSFHRARSKTRSRPQVITFEHRWAEYKFLYNETPPASWFGWKFYNDSIPEDFKRPT